MSATTLFPQGCLGAVSMTYDDGIDAHLDHAIPDLEAHGLRGTFYIPTRKDNAFGRRGDEWRSAARRGHEIGNHTQHHPCSRSFPFVLKGFALEDYDLARMEAELRGATSEIQAVTGLPQPVSFAYTCCQDFVGPQRTSFRPLADRLFPASRGGREYGSDKPILADPQSCDFTFVPAWMLWGRIRLASILAFVDAAVHERKWAILMFHGVGGGHSINVTRAVHGGVCKHIASLRQTLWCDTFVNVATHLRAATGRPWHGPSPV